MSQRNIEKAILDDVAAAFDTPGKCESMDAYGNGHINDTFVGRCSVSGNGLASRFIFQRINTSVFRDPEALSDNIARVTGHLRAKMERDGIDPERRTLTLIPAKTPGKGSGYMHRDVDGGYWRCYRFIEDSVMYESLTSADQAYEASKCFGGFLAGLADLPGPRLHETIVDFHNTPVRYQQFATALAGASPERIEAARREIDFAQARRQRAGRLVEMQQAGKLPERIAHNDTKVNNVLFDQSGSGLCVIDLDTVMPSLALYDFGDSVRLGANPAAEDERDLSLVHLDMEMFSELARGFLEGSAGMLTEAERGELVFSAWLITMEIGVRFLSDFLAGDVYFRTSRDGHNLDRCRTQFRLVEHIEAAADQMQHIVDQL